MSFELVLPFDTDDPAFVRGFECGGVWAELGRLLRSDTDLLLLGEQALRPGELVLDVTVHVEGAEMMLRMAEAKRLVLEWEELGDGWARARFLGR